MNNRIREYREARTPKLSQAKLAEWAGTTPGQISKLENDTEGKLDLAWMRRIAEALGLYPSDLLPDADVRHRLSAEEEQLVAMFRSLNGAGRARFLNVCRALYQPVADDTGESLEKPAA